MSDEKMCGAPHVPLCHVSAYKESESFDKVTKPVITQ
jgi:hypothetical protein